MPTFTISVTSTKVKLTAGTGTLAQLYADLYTLAGDAETYMSRTGSDPYVYEFKLNGGNYTEFEISNNVVVNQSNAGDELRWESIVTSSTYTHLDVQDGGTFNVTGDDCIVDWDPAGTSRPYLFVYGSFNVQGSSGHEVIMRHYRSIYFYTRGHGSSWDYFKFQSDISYTSGYGIAVTGPNSSTRPAALSFTNGKVECTGATESGYAMLWNTGTFFPNVTVDNVTFENHLYWLTSNCTFKMSNCTWKDIAKSYPRIYGGGKEQGGRYITSKTDPWSIAKGQPKITFDTCVYDNNYDDTGSNYAFYEVGRGSVVFFKNCTFQNAYRGVRVDDGGIAIHYNSTFTNITNADKVWESGTGGTHLHARMLNLTVQDADSQPIENAVCYLREKSNRDYFMIETNASGEAKDLYGDDCILIEKEETSLGVFADWNDYELIVSASGYVADVSDLDPSTGDISKTVVLGTNAPNQTTIYGSTIYGSTIY